MSTIVVFVVAAAPIVAVCAMGMMICRATRPTAEDVWLFATF